MVESGEQAEFLLWTESGNEVRSFAEHVEQVEDGQDDLHIAGGEQGGEVLHRAVDVLGETVLDQQRGEDDDVDQQILVLLVLGQVTGQRPLAVLLLVYAALHDRVEVVEHIDPMIELALAIVPALDVP